MLNYRKMLPGAAGVAASLLLAAAASHAQEGRPTAVLLNETQALPYYNVRWIGPRDPADEAFGAVLAPVGDALRAQLGLPAGQGLLVSALQPDGPCAAAGLKDHDVLLALGDAPVASAKDLADRLKAAGDAPIALKLLRAGKPLTLTVRARSTVTIGRGGEAKRERFIGVSVEVPDDALRAQLGLPADRGALVTSVAKGGPAAAAGILPFDVVVEFGGKPVDKPDTLTAMVRESKGEPKEAKLLRAGKPVTLTVAAAERTVDEAPSAATVRLWWAQDASLMGAIRNVDASAHLTLAAAAAEPPAGDREAKLSRQLDELQKEVAALRAAVNGLGESVRGGAKKE